MSKIKRALISVSNKTGIVDFVKALVDMGVEILSTGGTAKALRDAGVSVKDVSEHTGSPEMFGGRVKTLHPKIHGGILFRRNSDEDKSDLVFNKIDPIDMVVVNLYPFEETIAKPNCTFDEAIENIDIGGPAMLRSAAKNHQHVIVVVDPADYNWILEELDEREDITSDDRCELAKKVFKHTSRYDGLIADYLEKVIEEQGKIRGGCCG